MKYIIIGAGGTGGILGFYMTKAGKDVTLIARNAHLSNKYSCDQANIPRQVKS